MLHKVRYMLVTLVFSLLAVGCGGGGGGGSSTGTTGPTASELAAAIYSVKTAGAEGYIVTGSNGTATGMALAAGVTLTGSSTAVTLEPDSLYMVTASGTLERVAIQDKAGAELPRGSVRPFDVQDINDTFLVMWFYIPGYDPNPYAGVNPNDYVPFLVRKSDGLAYNMSAVIKVTDVGFSPTGLAGDFLVVADDNNNLFIANTLQIKNPDGTSAFWPKAKIFRIDTSNLGNGNLTAQAIQQVDIVRSFAVPGNGNYVIYSGESIVDPTQTVLRMVDIGSGSLTELQGLVAASLTAGNPGPLWGALDGNAYVGGFVNGVSTVFRVSQVNGAAVAEPLGTMQSESVKTKVINNSGWVLPALEAYHKRFVLDGREFLVQTGLGSGQTYEILLNRMVNGVPSPLVRRHDVVLNELSTVREARVSGKYVWYFGADIATQLDAIVRYDPLTETTQKFAAFTDPTTGASLDISKFRVLSSDQVFFEALRLSDLATVIGTIDSQGTVTITDVVAADEPTIYVLEPITPADFVTIDGKVKDWALGLRVANDASGDVAAGDDLTFYSQIAGNGGYLGLVEFNGAVGGNHRTRIRINGGYEVRIDSGAASIVPIDANGYVTGASQSLAAIGAESAVSEAVEFRLPGSALGNPASYTVDIARIGDADVELLSETSAGGVFTLTAGMATPLGNGTVKLGLVGGGYTLSVTSTTAILDDGTTPQDLVAVGGTITRGATTITITLPATAVGGAAALNPTEIETTLDAISVI